MPAIEPLLPLSISALPGQEAREIARAIKAAFLECMYWADTGEDCQPQAGADLSHDADRKAEAITCEYMVKVSQALGRPFLDLGRAGALGHCLYLDMAGHGAGAEDGGLGWNDFKAGALARIAREIADPEREIGYLEIYQGDDGLIYFV